MAVYVLHATASRHVYQNYDNSASIRSQELMQETHTRCFLLLLLKAQLCCQLA